MLLVLLLRGSHHDLFDELLEDEVELGGFKLADCLFVAEVAPGGKLAVEVKFACICGGQQFNLRSEIALGMLKMGIEAFRLVSEYNDFSGSGKAADKKPHILLTFVK